MKLNHVMLFHQEKKKGLSSANVMILSCKHIWARSLLKVIKMWSQLHSLYDFTLSHVMKFASADIFLTWFSEECLCLCVSHQEVVRVTWLALSAIAADERSADTPPNPDIVSLDHNPVLNFSKRDHTSEHDNRTYLLWMRWRQPQRKRARRCIFSSLLMQVGVWKDLFMEGKWQGVNLTGLEWDS